MFPDSTHAEGNCPSCHQMRYWVVDLIPSPGKALPDEVDRCLTGPRGMIHELRVPNIKETTNGGVKSSFSK
ncbi:unnamed protein product [Brassica oleracea]|uniref:(rape) hypothetical protein n=1 Tax=Brassica napus TaxID=3708 RepID=A0A816N0N5_BRANA|nr:unnamed protein product [Brassica napus]